MNTRTKPFGYLKFFSLSYLFGLFLQVPNIATDLRRGVLVNEFETVPGVITEELFSVLVVISPLLVLLTLIRFTDKRSASHVGGMYGGLLLAVPFMIWHGVTFALQYAKEASLAVGASFLLYPVIGIPLVIIGFVIGSSRYRHSIK